MPNCYRIVGGLLHKHENSWLRLSKIDLRVKLVIAAALTVLVISGGLAYAGTDKSSGDDIESGTFTGMITDSMCDARHVKHPDLDSANCTRECVRTGAKYTLIDGDKSYVLRGDSAELGQFAGQRAKVTGTLSGETIRVSAVNPL